jgi:hypothetical protein
VCKGERVKERRQRASHPKQHQSSQKSLQTYKLTQTKERRLFRKKARQLDEEALIENERQQSIQNSRKFYKRLNDVRRPFEPQVAMCRAKNGELLTNKNQVLARWKEHKKNIEGALKYSKNNKAAGADSIAAKLLNNGGPYLVDA